MEPEVKICSICFSKKAQGVQHDCSKRAAVSNLILLAFTLGACQAENVAAGILRQKMKQENIPDGADFSISSGGRPLALRVGTPDNKCSRHR